MWITALGQERALEEVEYAKYGDEDKKGGQPPAQKLLLTLFGMRVAREVQKPHPAPKEYGQSQRGQYGNQHVDDGYYLGDKAGKSHELCMGLATAELDRAALVERLDSGRYDGGQRPGAEEYRDAYDDPFKVLFCFAQPLLAAAREYKAEARPN